MATSGYSGTPLVKKLGIKEGFDVLFVDVPVHYLDLLIDLPDIQIMKSPEKETADFIHLFCTTLFDFEEKSLEVKPFLVKNGTL